MSSNKISKQTLVNYIQEQVENLHKLYILKEQKENIKKDIQLLEEGKKKKKDSKYSEKAKEVISAKLSKMADEKIPQDQKVAIAINTAKRKGLKVPAEKKSKKKKINEGFSEKGIMTVQEWIEKFGSREAAVKLMDNILMRMVGFSSSDLPDTATFANGLDEIEKAFNEKDYNGALEIAKDTAREMLEDEGFGDM